MIRNIAEAIVAYQAAMMVFDAKDGDPCFVCCGDGCSHCDYEGNYRGVKRQERDFIQRLRAAIEDSQKNGTPPLPGRA